MYGSFVNKILSNLVPSLLKNHLFEIKGNCLKLIRRSTSGQSCFSDCAAHKLNTKPGEQEPLILQTVLQHLYTVVVNRSNNFII